MLTISHTVAAPDAISKVATLSDIEGGVSYAGNGLLYGYAEAKVYQIDPTTEQVTETTPTSSIFRAYSKGTRNNVLTSAGQVVFGIGIGEATCPKITYRNLDGVTSIESEDWGAIVKHTPWADPGTQWQVFGFDSPSSPRICPTGIMAIDQQDNLYFISRANNKENVYRLSADWAELTLLKEFDIVTADNETTTAEGRTPTGVYVNDDSTTLYVVNQSGGNNPFPHPATGALLNGFGTIARIDLTSPEFTYEVIRHSNIAEDGQLISSRNLSHLIENDGKLYYSTRAGSALASPNDTGSISRLELSAGTAEQIHESRTDITLFGRLNDPKGRYPIQLLRGENHIYGTTLESGSSNNKGTLFKLNPQDGALTTLHAFGENAQVDDKPEFLTLGLNGAIYGVTLLERIVFSLPAEDENKPRILSFYPQNPQLTWTQGDLQTQLHWNAENAESCIAAAGDWVGGKPLQSDSAGETVDITKAVNEFTLTCVKGEESISRTVRVLARDLPPAQPSLTITSFSATPDTITEGNSVVLSWEVANAVSCSASGLWTGARNAASGTETVTPAVGSQVYTLACANQAGDSEEKSVTITVNAIAASSSSASSSSTINTGGGSGGGSSSLLILLSLSLLMLFQQFRIAVCKNNSFITKK
jgi:uncharacterized repeat protein (TIGR03803 family)